MKTETSQQILTLARQLEIDLRLSKADRQALWEIMRVNYFEEKQLMDCYTDMLLFLKRKYH
jgi:hypothetical protein